MNGYRFYLEFPTTYRKKKSGKDNKGHSGSVCAVVTEGEGARYIIRDPQNGVRVMSEGFGGIYGDSNPPVSWTSFNHDYINKKCKRISEAKARQIHPALFERLDETD